MSDDQEYEVEIEFTGTLHVIVTASNAEEAREKAKFYNPTALEVREAVTEFNVDPWDRLED